jgi:hypothetical protein
MLRALGASPAGCYLFPLRAQPIGFGGLASRGTHTNWWVAREESSRSALVRVVQAWTAKVSPLAAGCAAICAASSAGAEASDALLRGDFEHIVPADFRLITFSEQAYLGQQTLFLSGSSLVLSAHLLGVAVPPRATKECLGVLVLRAIVTNGFQPMSAAETPTCCGVSVVDFYCRFCWNHTGFPGSRPHM